VLFRSCSVAAAALFLRAPSAAVAGEIDAGDAGSGARERAQELLEKGNALFRAGDFREALARYREAHQAFNSPKIFYNMGLCEENLGEGPRALEHFTTFLREAQDAGPASRADAEVRTTALHARLVLIEVVKVPPNAAIRIDGTPSGLTPLAGPVWLLPGPHRLSVEAVGRPLWLTSIDGKPGETLTLEMPAAIGSAPRPPIPSDLPRPTGPGAAPADGTAERSTARRLWWLWTGLGVVLIGGATITYFSLRCPANHCE
jgi:tetratricopeptide (TPR) repeat protein